MTHTGDESVPVEELKFLTPKEVANIARRFGTPVFVYDEAKILQAVKYMTSLPSAFGHTIRYSLKANPNQAIIRLFDRQGVSFDASSVWEVIRAVRAGVDPSRILLTAQDAAFSKELDDLLDSGLKFDAGSLRQLDEFGSKRPGATVSIRINPGFGSGLVPKLTSGGPDSSFGIWYERLPEIKKIIERYDLIVERLHTHIGSGHYADVLLPAARTLLGMIPELRHVNCIDLGGGYRLKVMVTDQEYNHAEWAEALAQEIAEVAATTGRRLHLELEPGTFLMANAGSLVTSVIDVVDTGMDGHQFIKIDGGLTEILRPSYYGAPHPIVAVSRDGNLPEEGARSCVSGHCCIAGDVLTVNGDGGSPLPIRLGAVTPGDYIVVERCGGYCSSMAMKNFNSYPEAPEILRRGEGRYDLIRIRQLIDQVIANEQIPQDLT